MTENLLQDERYRFAAIAFVLVSIIAQIAFGIVTFTDTALFVLMVTMASIAAAADYHMFERYSKRGGNGAQGTGGSLIIYEGPLNTGAGYSARMVLAPGGVTGLVVKPAVPGLPEALRVTGSA